MAGLMAYWVRYHYFPLQVEKVPFMVNGEGFSMVFMGKHGGEVSHSMRIYICIYIYIYK